MKRCILSRLTAALLALVLVLCVLPAAAAAEHPFTDVAEGSYYRSPVVWAYRENITAGTSGTTFSPHKKLSYAEVATFLYRFAYSPAAHFTDSRLSAYAGKYYYKAINWCCDFGILTAEELSKERGPNAIMSRNDYVYTLYRYAQKWEKRSVSVSKDWLKDYVDAPAEERYRAAWNWALDRGVVSGTSPGKLSPEKRLTRCQFVTMLYRYQEYRIDRSPAEALQVETLLGKQIRGWEKTLLEAGELACGVPWVDNAYEIGPDGIPTLIDCSGLVNWMFSYTGIYPYSDLNSRPLWKSGHFTRIGEKRSGESGFDFYTRIASGLKLGDLMFCGSYEGNYHVMIYLGADADQIFVFHSIANFGTGIQAFPVQADTRLLKLLYGVKRHIP